MVDSNNKGEKTVDCRSAGKGFARTEGSDIVAENCPLPSNQAKGFARTEDNEKPEVAAGRRDCSSAGKGFARTEGNDIASEDCALPDGPGKGFAKTDQPK